MKMAQPNGKGRAFSEVLFFLLWPIPCGQADQRKLKVITLYPAKYKAQNICDCLMLSSMLLIR